MARPTTKGIRASMAVDAQKKEYGKYDKYEVEGWASTLHSAAEILADADKMKAVKKCMLKKGEAMDMLDKLTAKPDEKD